MFNYFVIFIIFGVFISANIIIGILVKQILKAGTLTKALKSSSKSSKEKRSQQEHESDDNESEKVIFHRMDIFEGKKKQMNQIHY